MLSKLWVAKSVTLPSGSTVKVHHKLTCGDELELTLKKEHKCTDKEAGYSRVIVTELIDSSSTIEELIDKTMPKMKEKWKGYSTSTRQKLRGAMLVCPTENPATTRRMTEDPIPDIRDADRPNLSHVIVPREAVGYILKTKHHALREMQTRTGASCCVDDDDASMITQDHRQYVIIRIWGDSDAVKKLGEAITASIAVLYQGGKGTQRYDRWNSEGKGEGRHGPY
jgi:hypothetical protein